MAVQRVSRHHEQPREKIARLWDTYKNRDDIPEEQKRPVITGKTARYVNPESRQLHRMEHLRDRWVCLSCPGRRSPHHYATIWATDLDAMLRDRMDPQALER